jgi:hypothetical protein
VRRWERREGLPVHRLLHNKLGTVYAYAAELAAWRDKRAAAVPIDAPGAHPISEVVPYGARARRVAALATLALTMAVGLIWLLHERTARPASAIGGIHSVVVLPLTNLSSDPEQEYFADGMTDALVTELAQVEG